MIEAPRRICVVTGSRADYGLLTPLLREIEADPGLALQLVVTGGHLSARHGSTVGEIEADGFAIAEHIDIGLASDSPAATGEAMARALAGMAGCLARLEPDVVVVLGDRYEIFGAAAAAVVARVPIAHIHGGEVTPWAYDDAFRHALTKMSSLHFVAADEFARRVIQMGENSDRVHVVGALGLEAIAQTERMDRAALEADLGFSLRPTTFVVTYHPVTLGDAGMERDVDALVAALDRFPDATVIITGVNADTGNQNIDRAFRAFADGRPDRVLTVDSLGWRRYFSAVAIADAVIGNSSSGIIEAPALGTPTVNVGHRQDGRPRSPSVIDCPADADEITAAIEKAMTPAFRTVAARCVSAYGRGDAARRMRDVLRTVSLSALARKTFANRAPAPAREEPVA